MDYPAYPIYRESGIEWLGKIPDHWEVKRLKYAFQLLTEKTERKDNPVGLENIEGWSGRFIETDSEFQGDGVAFEQGDILFGKLRPYLAKVHLAQFAGEAVGDFHVLRPIGEIIGIFGLYQCLNKDFITNVDSSTYGAKMPRVSWEYMANMLLVFPSLTEQRKISAFLDHKTQQIDQLISKKQTLIDKLNEQRIALITHAVTKGLNPAVTLEDSGVEWLGKVPKHWEISKLGYFSESLQTGPFGSQIHAEEYIDGGIPLINPAEIINGILRYNPRVTVDYATAERLKRHQLMEGDIVIARRGEMGRAGLTKKENVGWLCGTGSLRARLETEKLMPEYLLQLFSLSGTADYLSLQSVGSTMDNLNTSILNQLPIIVPPIEEQREIEAYLDKETARIDRMVELNKQTIDKLKEYRTALITAAVTGKIDVRNWRQTAPEGA